MKTDFISLGMPAVPERHRDQADAVRGRIAAIEAAIEDGWDMLYVCGGPTGEYLVTPDDVEAHVAVVKGVLPLGEKTELLAILAEDAEWLEARGVQLEQLAVYHAESPIREAVKDIFGLT